MCILNFHQRKSSKIEVGGIKLGGDEKIRIQSMTDTDTLDTKKSIQQAIRMIKSGAEIIRFTTQGLKEVQNLKNIKKELSKRGYHIPLVADVHFNPSVAEIAAKYAEKVRINPGNYADAKSYSKNFKNLLIICRKYETAIRIGVNQGSLSERILEAYGSTPLGMVESCMEFLRICKKFDFNNVVVSIKSSNTVMMIKTNRLLVEKMAEEDMKYPLHLGVTEAGEGDDGRIKSALGIGVLLKEGIGDTIRVSLTEPPENEAPFAKKLIRHSGFYHSKNKTPFPQNKIPFKLTDFYKRQTYQIQNIGSSKVPIVLAKNYAFDINQEINKQRPELVILEKFNIESTSNDVNYIVPYDYWIDKKNVSPIFDIDEFLSSNLTNLKKIPVFVKCKSADFTKDFFDKVNANKNTILIYTLNEKNIFYTGRELFYYLHHYKCKAPVIFYAQFTENHIEDLQIKTALNIGGLFVDGLGNGIYLENKGEIENDKIIDTAFSVLQAARVRISKTEFISCPGCGRTLFDLQEVTAQIKKDFSHLKHLKIAIMGCIVNGPGEMGDADYGYVGGGHNTISLYKRNNLILRNIPSDKAIGELKKIIKKNNDWIEPTNE